MDDMSIMRYAHCEGHTDLCYDESGKYLITCGTDGDIRIWDGFEDDDPKSHHMGETVSAVAFKKGCIYLSSDANSVVVYTFPRANCDGVILQFYTSVYHITCSQDGKYIAAGGGDFIIKVYNDPKKNFAAYRGHDAPILSLAFDPKEKYLASSSCDGTVRVWLLSDQSCVQTWKILKRCNDFCASETLCRLEWHPKNGKFLAVPVEKELRFYEKDSWDCKFTLRDESIIEKLSIATFSPCGSYIAASSVDGQILVWNLKKQKCVFKKPHEKNIKICSLVWNPSGKKELAFCDIEGQLGVFEDVLSVETKNDILPKQDHANGVLDSDDEVDLQAKSNFGEKKDKPNLNSLGIDGASRSSIFDDENEFDIGAIKAKLEPKIFGTDDNDDILSTKSEHVPIQPKAVEVPTTPLQSSFQPSSTPLSLEHRFMVWNSVGIVRSYNTEEENSIDVEFHDTSVYHPVHLNNMRGFTMAALSTEALLMASPKVDEAPSKLECLHIGTWDSNKEWTIDMIEDEEIEAIALGSGWAVAATDKRLIRLFTVSGVQCEVFCAPGPVVCLAATENQLAVAYHRGAGIPGEQNLALMLVSVNLKARSVVKDYPLPLSSKAFLTWLGYTDEGQPCAVDTSGIVKLLNTACASKWIPVANTKSQTKGKSDNYFVVGISEIQQEIRCIPCKGSRYPPMLPRPTVIVLPFNLPFCEMTTDKGRFEEEQGRSALLHSRIKLLLSNGFDLDSELSAVERKWTDILLKMFALATRTEREYRALDIAELMPNHRVVQGAIRYATQKHRIALAERLGEVVHKKLVEETTAITNDNEMESEEEDSTTFVPVNYRPGGSLSNENQGDILQPKPLSRSRFSLSTTTEHVEEDENLIPEDNDAGFPSDSSISLIPKSQPQVNPFKVQPKQKSDPTGANKLSQTGIDDILSESTRRLSSKGTPNSISTEKKTSRQSTLFPQKAKKDQNGGSNSANNLAPKKFGISLFLEEKRDELKEENPDMDAQEIVKLATKLFKSLLPEEKQKYQKTAPKQKENEVLKFSSSKRKHDTEEDPQIKTLFESTSEPKKSKVKKDDSKAASVTMKTLSMFAFTKTSSE